MAQVPDFLLEDGTGVQLQQQLHAVFAALASSNAGPVAPANPFAGMVWMDTSATPVVWRIRDAANQSWTPAFYFDAGSGEIRLAGMTTSVADLNYVDGVTSNIQSQLNGKLSSSATTFSGDSTRVDDITGRISSGFYETPSASLAEGWPANGQYYHLLAVTHPNEDRYYSMQFAASFYDNGNLYYRSADNNGNTPWAQIYSTANPPPASVPTTAQVLAATAGASVGAVGTYAWAGRQGASTIDLGATYAGSALVFGGFLSTAVYSDNTANDLTGGEAQPAGTWRAMGVANIVSSRAPSTLFLRIA